MSCNGLLLQDNLDNGLFYSHFFMEITTSFRRITKNKEINSP